MFYNYEIKSITLSLIVEAMQVFIPYFNYKTKAIDIFP